MPRTVDLVWIPGLCGPWLDQAVLPHLAEQASTRATLRCGFPNVPAAVEATILSGLPPREHGCLGQETFPHRPPPREAALTTWPEVRIHRRTALWNLLREHGPTSSRVRAALREADTEWTEHIAAADEDRVVMICGGPSYRLHRPRYTIDLSGLPPLQHRAEGGILRVVLSSLPGKAVRDALLRTAGVERVLAGRGLRLWGADHPQAGDLVAVAEPTWSFTDEAITYGSLEDAPARPVVLVYGGRPDWPGDVHDVRIAPTVARYVGRPLDGFSDGPLDL